MEIDVHKGPPVIRRTKTLTLIYILVILSFLPIDSAFAGDDEGGFDAVTRGNGVFSSATLAQVGLLKAGKNLDGSAVTTPWEYSTRLACQTADIGGDDNAACYKAATGCLGNSPTEGVGLMYEILRRPLGSNGAWEFIATTCFGDQVPGTSPVVTLAMVLDAFHNTPWAKPVITTEPKGNVTLVALDTFYKVNWSSDGFQPNEVEPIDPATMLGFEVDIRPRLDHFTYFFGDGQDFGPTSNEGGVYPSGGITHQYLKAGDYPARVDTTFGGEFRINGGAWAPIPDTVTVPGPPTNVTVRTARAELVNH